MPTVRRDNAEPVLTTFLITGDEFPFEKTRGEVHKGLEGRGDTFFSFETGLKSESTRTGATC